jgi:uncharacterized protein (DUF885 family)
MPRPSGRVNLVPVPLLAGRRRAHRAVLMVAIFLCPLACQASEVDVLARKIYSDDWAWRQEHLLEPRDDERVMRGLPHVDAKAQAAALSHWREVAAQLSALPATGLSPAEAVNYEVFRRQIDVLIANLRFRDYEMPVNSDTNFWSDFGSTARLEFRGEQEYRNWLAQMRYIPRFFAEQQAQMQAGLGRGFTPPAATLVGRELSLVPVIDREPEQTFLYLPFIDMRSVAPALREGMRSEARAVIRDEVQPAYRKFLTYFRDVYLPKARSSVAAYDLPDGEAYYSAKILEFTTLPMTPGEIHDYGLAEVERLHGEMVAAMRATGFKGDFAEFLTFLRSDPRFYPRSADELLMRAAWIAKRFDGKAARYFGYLPRKRFAIIPVPAEIAPFYTAGRGDAEAYLVNTFDLPQRPLYNLPALTLHESAPGHAMQGAVALELKDQPEFRRHSYISAYGEGWALYCEELGLEMGMYDTDYERFGMLGYQIWRAARLVVDTGIHSRHWTLEQARDYLRRYTALPEREIGTEIDRYASWPGQALSYYIGKAAITRARRDAEAALGDRFNIRAFHDEVLNLGSVPLSVLRKRTDVFIESGGAGPYPELE